MPAPSTRSIVPQAAGTDPLIRISHLSKRYSLRKSGYIQALNDVDVDIRPGEFVAIVGPSGCGKTTMLKIIAGLLEDFTGVVTLGGTAVDGPSPHVGMVFQNPTLLPWLTVLQNILIPAKLQHLDIGQYRDRAESLLKLVGLRGFADGYPGELSGGMQQRAGICRALVSDPAVLLMDEPFASLDAITRDDMNIELQHIWRRSASTAVLVTHSIHEALFLADRVAVMSPHPGTIIDVIDVDLPRPRTMDDLNSAQAVAAATKIRTLLHQMLEHPGLAHDR